jgi:hypothetical protein
MALCSSRAFMPLTLAILAILPGCKRPISAFGQCLSLAGRNPADDAGQDYHNGERYLMTDIDGGNSANVFIPNHKGQKCNFIHSKDGPLLRSNRRPLQTLPSGDSVTEQEQACIDQYHVYLEAYNREFERLDHRAFERTCSEMTLAEARKQFGNEVDEAAFVKR